MLLRAGVSRESITRSIFVARVILFAITFGLIAVAVATAFAQERVVPRPSARPPAREMIEARAALAQAKAERFARTAPFASTPTANQQDWDAVYYDLDLELIPNTATITGTVTIEARVVAASISTMDLDFATTGSPGMTVSEVRVGNEPVPFTHSGDILSVTLNITYTANQIVTVEVDYSGTPDPSYGAFGFDVYNVDDMIWSLSEPFGARSWWPCKDDPSDKADSVDVRIRVPGDLVVASNGTLVSVTDVPLQPKVDYHWREGYPIATYLVSVAAHPYTEFSDWYHTAPTDSMEIRYFVFPDHYASVQASYSLVPDMLTVFAGLFGEYPFIDEKYGHAEFLWGGGMEHQTCTSLGTWNEGVVAHELGHQWFGDMITCDDFHHIWLNEGFASYCEALWEENYYGEASYWSVMLAAKYLGPGTIYVPDTSDWNRIFSSSLSYNKASWVPHMLRHFVGDATFFACLQAYYSSVHQYGSATTEEFRDICESVSGMDLDWFFQQWIYEEYYPAYSYQWGKSTNASQWDVALTIDQLQTSTIFKMPVDVNVQFASGDTTIVVWDSLGTQAFTLTVDDEPVAVSLDPDQWILRSVEQQVSDPTFHRGVLLVNGVHFDTYGSEITTAYADSAFTGFYPFTFWDCFSTPPSGGYPAELPAPIGTGPIPADTLSQFSTVVWVGNNYAGDIPSWYDTPVVSYLNSGGNVLLLSRLGQDFMTPALQDYLGIAWAEASTVTLNNCVGLPPFDTMPLIGSQTFCAVFDTTLTQPESELLFMETASFGQARGIGAWRRPAGGGLHRSDGGNFAFVSGRPYRYHHAALAANDEIILGNLFEEPKVPTAVGDATAPAVFALRQNYPNPFNPHTTIRFSLPSRAHTTLRVYDVAGRLVKTLAARTLAAGPHALDWDGTDNRGARVASGVYFYRLRTDARTATRKMVMVR